MNTARLQEIKNELDQAHLLVSKNLAVELFREVQQLKDNILNLKELHSKMAVVVDSLDKTGL